MGVGEIPGRGRQPSSGTPENTTTMKSQALEAEKPQSLRCVENLEREGWWLQAPTLETTPRGLQEGRCAPQVQRLGRSD